MSEKARLDVVLVERSLAASRDEAQRLIRAGVVLIDEIVHDKPGVKVDVESPIRVARRETPFASRGGFKLQRALDVFEIDPAELTAADFGASNGGFTDCLLQRGAARVYAIDVGRGQLAYALQTDPRVVVMDRTNCRYVTRDALGEAVDLVVGDLSFISVKKLFDATQSVLKPGGTAVMLIKPQFEIGKGRVGKNGVVRRREDHHEVLVDCYDFYVGRSWSVIGVTPSPIEGKSGNVEFLFHLAPRPDRSVPPEALESAVNEAHERTP
ncbi:MAG: TlyA family rRNA (cytidine-2'-O)-methyltransferase [bacterium]|nr:TlyA family rRNA (cytidine-2'-O)-methyltransferase [bacterium]